MHPVCELLFHITRYKQPPMSIDAFFNMVFQSVLAKMEF